MQLLEDPSVSSMGQQYGLGKLNIIGTVPWHLRNRLPVFVYWRGGVALAGCCCCVAWHAAMMLVRLLLVLHIGVEPCR